jgi:farnesyl-diphosphate farnesyltransferase
MQPIHRQLLRATSRTFALSIERLPGLVSDSLCLGYLLLRVSDYLEDNRYMPAKRKVELLELWAEILSAEQPATHLAGILRNEAAADDEPDAIAARACGEILAGTETLPKILRQQLLAHVRSSTLGMARWVARGPLVRDESDMDDYMHEVAGRVGFLVTDVFAWHSRLVRGRLEKLKSLARDFGLALQTVNIIRGLRKDHERGWIYVPESFCHAAKISREQLFAPEYRKQALQVVDSLVTKAERHLLSALAYVQALPRWPPMLRLACAWPLLFAVRTAALSRRNVNVLCGEVKITRSEVATMIRKSMLRGWSNAWLANYVQQLSVVQSVR